MGRRYRQRVLTENFNCVQFESVSPTLDLDPFVHRVLNTTLSQNQTFYLDCPLKFQVINRVQEMTQITNKTCL